MLKLVVSRNLIHGVKFSQNLIISHLLFADDSLVFTYTSLNDCLYLKRILYSTAFGQIFNFDKSSMFFSPNVSQSVTNTIKSIINLTVIFMHKRYLGLPSMVGRNKKSYFNKLKTKTENKLKGQKARLFLCGGKEIMIKGVAQAILTYTMSVFKISSGFCEEIHKSLTAHWWQTSTRSKSIHQVNWLKLCQPKTKEGLGFEISAFLIKHCYSNKVRESYFTQTHQQQELYKQDIFLKKNSLR